MEKVKIVIPLYTADLSADEWLTLRHNIALMRRYPIVLLMSEGMSSAELEAEFPQCEQMRVSDEWLGRKNGVAGYNRMMLTADFYDLFADCEYILVCQTDAWIFRDELSEWCARGYDCVGGVWWRRGVWALPLVRSFCPRNRLLYGRVGNGGLSLRRISSFRRACQELRERIDYYLNQKHHIYNEDVFWAVEPRGFRYPAISEAVAFSFDSRPERCLEETHGKLPFGCHGWSKPGRAEFWRRYITT